MTDKGDRKRILPDGESLPLAELLDEERFTSIIGGVSSKRGRIVRCRITRLRYRPGRLCAIQYSLDIDTGETVRNVQLYAKCVSNDHIAKLKRAVETNTWVDGVVLNGPAFLPEQNAVVYEFPNDARLPALRLLAEPGELGRVLGPHLRKSIPGSADAAVSWRLLRYKPEKRLVARCEAGRTRPVPFILRMQRPSKVEASARTIEHVSHAAQSTTVLDVPQPLFWISDAGVIAHQFLEGAKLSEIILGDEPDAALTRVAHALSTFHDLPATALPDRSMEEAFQRAEENVRGFCDCAGHIRQRAARVWDELMTLSKCTQPGRVGLVHGDFHQGQVLLDGTKVRLLDLDGAHLGEVAADVANFMAQMELLRIAGRLSSETPLEQRFLEGYQDASGLPVVGDRLNLWTALALFELAAREFRRLKHQWPERVVQLLEKSLLVMNA